MTDDMIRALGGKGGVIMINYARTFLSDELYQAGLNNVPMAQRPPKSTKVPIAEGNTSLL